VNGWTGSDWIEERIEALRLALGVSGFPTVGEFVRMTEWLRFQPETATKLSRHRKTFEPGTPMPGVPLPGWGVDGDEPIGMIECGHAGRALADAGLWELVSINSIEPPVPDNWGGTAGAGVRFAASWFLPSGLLRRITDDDELAWQSNCDPDVVRFRRAELGERVCELNRPPLWAAGHSFHMVVMMAASRPMVTISPRVNAAASAPLPLPFSVAVTRASADIVAAHVATDLAALTLAEFSRRYGTGPAHSAAA
jgi:hypothetical protein